MSKRNLLSIALCLGVSSLFAQTVHTNFLKTIPVIDAQTPDWARLMYAENPHLPTLDSLYQVWRSANPTAKTTHTQNYKHWRHLIENYLDTEGFISRLREYDAQLQAPPKAQLRGAAGGNWTIVGPIQSVNQTNHAEDDDRHANVYSIDIFEGDANILYCGSESGGIFKTTDKGLNWTFLTAAYPIKSVQEIQIHPTNSNIVFAASSGTLFRTTDGGSTWITVFTGTEINDIIIHPSSPNIILIATNSGIFRSTTNGDASSFSNILSNKAFELEVKADDPSVFFALVDDSANKMCKFYKSTDNGASFTVRSTGWLSLNTNDQPLAGRNDEGGRLAVTPANANRIYAYLIGETKSGDAGHIGLWKSDDVGESWTLVSPDRKSVV